ncbi:MAG TPA: hypothetical protein VIA06_22070 [Candidatus Dormibacteraeota bacterium]|jgi:hypothetical protein|nr:hypothetical protein [Candidatus Dormibacteraeota bacterium]
MSDSDDETRPPEEEAAAEGERHGQEEEGEENEHEHGLAHTLQEKLIRFDSMDRGLLALTLIAIAAVILTAVLILVKDLPWPLLPVTTSGEKVITVPLPVLVASGIFLVLAWSYLLTGAMHSHLVLRILVLIAFTLSNAALWLGGGNFFAAIGILLLLALVWAMSAALWVVDRFHFHRNAPHRHPRRRLKLPTFLFFVGATTALYVIAFAVGAHTGDFGFSVNLQLSALQFALIPLLYLAGTDFAEWAEVVAGRVGTAVANRRDLVGSAGLVVLLVVAAGATIWYSLNLLDDDFRISLLALIPGTIVLLVIAAFGIAAMRRAAKASVPFWSIVVAGMAGYACILVGSAVSVGTGGESATPTSYQHAAAPVFSISYGRGWSAERQEQIGAADVWTFGTTDPTGLPARLTVVAEPSSGSTSDLLQTVGPRALNGTVEVTSTGVHGAWQERRFELTSGGSLFLGRAWTRKENGELWMVTGTAPYAAGGAYDARFAQDLASWQPEVSGSDTSTGNTTFPAIYTFAPFLWIPLVIVGVIFILEGGELATGGLFLAASGIFFLAFGAQYLFYGLIGHTIPHVVPGTMSLMDWAIGVGSVIYAAFVVATGRLRRHAVPLRLVLILVVGFLGLRLLYSYVFQTALEASARFTLVQAVVLLLAILWDVAMSGENLTNLQGWHVPRHSRVLLYFGYVIMVATAVLFFSSLHAPPGEGTDFESDMWPQLGILLMGPPLLLTFFFANLGHWLYGGRPAVERPPVAGRVEDGEPQPGA